MNKTNVFIVVLFSGLAAFSIFNFIRCEKLKARIDELAAKPTNQVSGQEFVKSGNPESTGIGTMFMGENSGAKNTTGDWNTFIGYQAGTKNTTGELNTFLGARAGNVSTIGFYNTFLGATAGRVNTTGYENTMVGQGAGYSNTTGHNNTFIGTQAGDLNLAGNENVIVGSRAGYSNRSDGNTFVGFRCGYATNTGTGNTFIGNKAGENNTSGSHNVIIGNTAQLKDSTTSNQLLIHNGTHQPALISGDFKNRQVAFSGNVEIFGSLHHHAPNGEPPAPKEGESVIWVGNGKNGGKKGDVMMKITAGGITKKIELVNFTDI